LGVGIGWGLNTCIESGGELHMGNYGEWVLKTRYLRSEDVY
jgi:hypothetical protein